MWEREYALDIKDTKESNTCSSYLDLLLSIGRDGRISFYDKAKQKYSGIIESQKSGNKTSSWEIGLNIKTHTSPKVGQDQMSGGVSVLCWHVTPVANVLWKPRFIR